MGPITSDAATETITRPRFQRRHPSGPNLCCLEVLIYVFPGVVSDILFDTHFDIDSAQLGCPGATLSVLARLAAGSRMHFLATDLHE